MCYFIFNLSKLKWFESWREAKISLHTLSCRIHDMCFDGWYLWVGKKKNNNKKKTFECIDTHGQNVEFWFWTDVIIRQWLLINEYRPSRCNSELRLANTLQTRKLPRLALRTAMSKQHTTHWYEMLACKEKVVEASTNNGSATEPQWFDLAENLRGPTPILRRWRARWHWCWHYTWI